jgi:hypothetical protein
VRVTKRWAPLLAVPVLGLAAACGTSAAATTSHVAAPVAVAAPTPAPTQFNAAAVTLRGCTALARWEVSDTPYTAGEDPQMQVIISESAGTQFASDLDAWVIDLQNDDSSDAISDSDAVNADCDAVGIVNVT